LVDSPSCSRTRPPPAYTLSLHDALPILRLHRRALSRGGAVLVLEQDLRRHSHQSSGAVARCGSRLRSHLCTLPSQPYRLSAAVLDRKSTRLNSSHVKSSYAVFCSKKQIH